MLFSPEERALVDDLGDVVMVSVELTSAVVADVSMVVLNSDVVSVLEGCVGTEVDLPIMSIAT